jgi:hypothetical protein
MKKSSLLLLCSAFLVTAVALFYAWTNWSGAREFQAALAQLEEKKESIRLEDFIPPPVRDDQNVAKAPIFQEFFASGKESRLAKLDLVRKNLSGVPAGENHLVQVAKKLDPQFSGDEAAAGRVVLEYLSQSAPVLEEVHEALRRPQVNWPLDFSKGFDATFDYGHPIMIIVQILRQRSLAELAVGSTDKAFEDALTILTLAGVTVPPQLTIAELVRNSILRIACDVINDGLRRGVWSDRELAAFSGSLVHQKLVRQLADSLRFERAMVQHWNWFDQQLLMLANGDYYGNQRKWKIVWQLRPAGWVNRDRALQLLLTQRVIESLGDGKNISPTEVRSCDSFGMNASKWDGITTPITCCLFSGTLISVVESVCFTQTCLESTRAACAVERYRLANKRLPEQLDDLVPAFLPEVPKDPLTGAPLFYTPSPDGSFVIYGVGWNQADDGGSVHSPQSGNFQKQADWGVFVSKG